MILFRLTIVIFAAALAGAIFWAMEADGRALGAVLADMAGDPWTVVTLADLYLGFFLSAAMIFILERSKVAAALWAAPIFFLGNLVTALWLVVRLPMIVKRLSASSR